MANIPKVSIILPSHNGNSEIIHALRSLNEQTYSNIEVVVVDDASETPLKETVSDCLTKVSYVYIRNTVNLGLAASLNVGINSSSGCYVARMDDDDFSLPHRIAKQVEFLESHNYVDVLGAGVAFYDQNLRFIRNYVFPADHESIVKSLCTRNPLAHPTVMMRRSFVQRSGGYDSALRRMEDLELWGRMAKHSKYANLPDILLRHRVRQSKVLSAVKQGIIIRLRNGRLLGCFWKSLFWTFQYALIEVARHWGYRQRAFRQFEESSGSAPGFTD